MCSDDANQSDDSQGEQQLYCLHLLLNNFMFQYTEIWVLQQWIFDNYVCQIDHMISNWRLIPMTKTIVNVQPDLRDQFRWGNWYMHETHESLRHRCTHETIKLALWTQRQLRDFAHLLDKYVYDQRGLSQLTRYTCFVTSTSNARRLWGWPSQEGATEACIPLLMAVQQSKRA